MNLQPDWRLCSLRPDDAAVLFRESFSDSNEYFGPVLDCKWNPNAPHCMALLTHSGVIRYWNTNSGASTDFTLYVPSQRTRRGYVLDNEPGDQIYFTDIKLFDFIPNTEDWIVFTLAESQQVYVSSIPSTKHAGGDHYAAGARVFELSQFPHPGTTGALEYRFPVCLAVARSGSVLVVGDDAGDLHVWTLSYRSDFDRAPGVRVMSLIGPERLTGPYVSKALVVGAAHDGTIACISPFAEEDTVLVNQSAAGPLFATVGRKDLYVRVWDTATGCMMCEIPIEDAHITRMVAFSAECVLHNKLKPSRQAWLALGHADGLLSVWSVHSRTVCAVVCHAEGGTPITSLSVCEVPTSALPLPSASVTGVSLQAMLSVTAENFASAVYTLQQLPQLPVDPEFDLAEDEEPRFVLARVNTDAVKSTADSPPVSIKRSPRRVPPLSPTLPRVAAAVASKRADRDTPSPPLSRTPSPQPVPSDAYSYEFDAATIRSIDPARVLDAWQRDVGEATQPAFEEAQGRLKHISARFHSLSTSPHCEDDEDEEPRSPDAVPVPVAMDATSAMPRSMSTTKPASRRPRLTRRVTTSATVASVPPSRIPVHKDYLNPARAVALKESAARAAEQMQLPESLLRATTSDPPVSMSPFGGSPPHPLTVPVLHSSSRTERRLRDQLEAAFDIKSATTAVKKQLQEDAQLGLMPKHVQSTLNFKPDDRLFTNLDELSASGGTPPPRATASKQLSAKWVQLQQCSTSHPLAVQLVQYDPCVRPGTANQAGFAPPREYDAASSPSVCVVSYPLRQFAFEVDDVLSDALRIDLDAILATPILEDDLCLGKSLK